VLHADQYSFSGSAAQALFPGKAKKVLICAQHGQAATKPAELFFGRMIP